MSESADSMRVPRRLLALPLLLLAFMSSPAHADALAAAGAGMFLPPEGGALGAALHLDAAYEWRLAKLALAPGLRFSGYLGPEDAVVGLASLRATLPGPIASPYLLVALGAGYHDEGGAVAVQAGAGLGFAVSRRLVIGAEASYVQLGHGSFRNLYFGPMLQLALPTNRRVRG